MPAFYLPFCFKLSSVIYTLWQIRIVRRFQTSAVHFSHGTQCTRLSPNISTRLINKSKVLQLTVLSPYLFSKYISHTSTSSSSHLFKSSNEGVFGQFVCGTEDFLNRDNEFSLFWFKSQKMRRVSMHLFTVWLPVWPFFSVANTHSGVVVDQKVRRSSQISSCVNQLGRLFSN